MSGRDAMVSGCHQSVAGGQQFGHLSFAIFPFRRFAIIDIGVSLSRY